MEESASYRRFACWRVNDARGLLFRGLAVQLLFHEPAHLELHCSFGGNLNSLQSFRVLGCSGGTCSNYEFRCHMRSLRSFGNYIREFFVSFL